MLSCQRVYVHSPFNEQPFYVFRINLPETSQLNTLQKQLERTDLPILGTLAARAGMSNWNRIPSDRTRISR